MRFVDAGEELPPLWSCERCGKGAEAHPTDRIYFIIVETTEDGARAPD
jgi:hypothetical protein